MPPPRINISGSLAKLREKRAAEVERASALAATMEPPRPQPAARPTHVAIAVATHAQGRAVGFGIVMEHGGNTGEWCNHLCGGTEREAQTEAEHLARTIAKATDLPIVFVSSGHLLERARDLARQAAIFYPHRVR